MSTTQPTRDRTWRDGSGTHYVSDSGNGWMLFSGTILILLATLNCIYGIAAVSNSKVFVGDAKYVISGLHTWGWTLIVISALQLATGIGIYFRVTFARWAGVAFATLNAMVQLMVMPAFPLWSLLLFSLDVFVVYGLLVHGDKVDMS